jgi:hemolysin activation/secretion protein
MNSPSVRARWALWRRTGSAVLSFFLMHFGAALAQDTPEALPGFAELEAAGATIGEIRVVTRDIFDTSDPKEDRLLFRWANTLHIQTRPGVVERSLLFKTGDALSLRVLEETERNLRSVRYLYDVKFRPVAWHDGIVDIEVETRDTWSLDVGASAGRSGGANSGGLHLKDYNLLGTGISVNLARSKNVDRSSNEFQFANEHLFGSATALRYSHATSSDGRSDSATLIRPFDALDTRRAAGITASRETRIDSIYNAGSISRQYRHRLSQAEAFAGTSNGLVDAWVTRYSVGMTLQDDRYTRDPALVAPAELPPDQKLVAPFLRYELIEDRFEKEQNRNLIGRPEYFALGLATRVQLGYALVGLGSTRNAWLYSGSVSRGAEPAAGQTLLGSARIEGQYADGVVSRRRMAGQLQYYRAQSPRWLFYAGASAEMLIHPPADEGLLLGGDSGLRGYPLRYQSGDRRFLFTAEERFYTDLYVWQLFRIGGAAFFDTGRAAGGANANAVNPGWLSNVGLGLRIVSARAAFSNVLHIDLAIPLNATADMKKLQFLVKTRASF